MAEGRKGLYMAWRGGNGESGGGASKGRKVLENLVEASLEEATEVRVTQKRRRRNIAMQFTSAEGVEGDGNPSMIVVGHLVPAVALAIIPCIIRFVSCAANRRLQACDTSQRQLVLL